MQQNSNQERNAKPDFEQRLSVHLDELKWLYMELYRDENAWNYFLTMLRKNFAERRPSLQAIDRKRIADPGWYRSNAMLGMMLYTENFGGTLSGVQEKLPYLEECGVRYLHLMPLLDSPKGRSDGGYAVSDFRKVRPDLGTMEDLEALADACHERRISVCLDFVVNHTSEEHAWAKAARSGDPVARSRYFFYENRDIPDWYESTVPQVFPTTAPGNFTWLSDAGQFVMTSFYPFQWDLNYANPMVFNDMTDNLLYLANRGMDVIRLDAIPYIWKRLGTNCRNLPEVHTLTRMMQLACRIVCPGVLLLGEVVMEPKEVTPYFGTREKPECDMLYNVTTMCTTWHTLATRDVRLLKRQVEQIADLPRTCLFQNYLRCHDDIGWGLDYRYLEQFGMQEVPHKRYLNDWFTGRWPGSWARGELYNDSAELGDARLCGTTASLTGVEAASSGGEGSGTIELELALRCDLMLHAWMFTLSGIPVLYSGDEIGQENDLSYHLDPEKQADSRYIHRGAFPWEKAERRHQPGTIENRIFSGIRRLASVRASSETFHPDAEVRTVETGSDQVIGVLRSYRGREFLGLYNFSEHAVKTTLSGEGFREILNSLMLELPVGAISEAEDIPAGEAGIALDGYAFCWLERGVRY